MLFAWNEQIARSWREASEYTGYDRAMAALLLPKLDGCRTLCDMGCGLGLVDLELAAHFAEIACVDVSQTALDELRRQAAARGIRNLRTVCADGKTVSGRWDAVMALFHGTVEDVVPAYLPLCADRLLLVVHGNAYGTTGPEGYRVRKCCDTESTAAWLAANGYRFTLENGELEFGQPHRSFEDALTYTRNFTKNVPEDELETYVRRTVTETGRADFPLYTPKKRTFGIFTIRRRENEQLS